MFISTSFFVSSCLFFFFKQKTAYEMRISDWSSDVCSSDLHVRDLATRAKAVRVTDFHQTPLAGEVEGRDYDRAGIITDEWLVANTPVADGDYYICGPRPFRSEEHTSELQSLMRISYAVFCLKKKKTQRPHIYDNTTPFHIIQRSR